MECRRPSEQGSQNCAYARKPEVAPQSEELEVVGEAGQDIEAMGSVLKRPSASVGAEPVAKRQCPTLSFPARPCLKLIGSESCLRYTAELYRLGRELGSGSFGSVRQAHRGDRVFVVKGFFGKADAALVKARAEAYCADLCRGQKHIVSLVDCFLSGESGAAGPCVHLVYEHAGCDLRSWIPKGRSSLTPMRIAGILRQVVTGVSFLHCHGLLHLDLKPENVLVESIANQDEVMCRIGDLGSCSELNVCTSAWNWVRMGRVVYLGEGAVSLGLRLGWLGWVGPGRSGL